MTTAMKYETDEIDGSPYISCEFLLVGDYCGTGDIGESNIRWLEDKYPEQVVVHIGGYSSRQAWLPDTQEFRELLEQLDDYPLFDDGYNSDVRVEWEEDAWRLWVCNDLVRGLPEPMRAWAEDVLVNREQPDDNFWDIYRQAMEDTNTYPVEQNNEVWVDTDRIQPTVNKITFVEMMGTESGREVVAAWVQDEAEDFRVNLSDPRDMLIICDAIQERDENNVLLGLLRGYYA